MRTLITGGTGKLAAELKKHLPGEYVGIENYDFTQPIYTGSYDLIVHMGAFTDVRSAEAEPNNCFRTNVFGTFQLVQAYKDIPFVYISTEYANNPLGVYALTKYLGEEIVKSHHQHLIIRTSFKPRPWPFPMAYGDQYTQGDYVDVIAKLLAIEIQEWNREPKLIYCGTGRKTLLQLARQTKPDVIENSVKDYTKMIGKEIIPFDYL